MTIWDFLDKIMGGWPPVTMLFLAAALAAVVIFIIGFSKHGVDFIKHGFKQTALDDSIKSELADLRGSIDGVKGEISGLKGEIDGLRTEVKGEISGLRTELDMIKVNHFGHLKNYLSVLDGILLDKNIISNQEKARLDNELRGM